MKSAFNDAEDDFLFLAAIGSVKPLKYIELVSKYIIINS